jgi:hypothetical protein
MRWGQRAKVLSRAVESADLPAVQREAPDPTGRGLAQTAKCISYLMPHNVQYTITFIHIHNVWKGIST